MKLHTQGAGTHRGSARHSPAPVTTRRAVLMACAALALPALAQQMAPASADMTDGEVRKVDKGAKKITLKHGEIKNLDMPPMTMVFQVKDAALLDKVKAGDKVRFKVEQAGASLVVTEIEPAR